MTINTSFRTVSAGLQPAELL